jgi:hypothetical protein
MIVPILGCFGEFSWFPGKFARPRLDPTRCRSDSAIAALVQAGIGVRDLRERLVSREGRPWASRAHNLLSEDVGHIVGVAARLRTLVRRYPLPDRLAGHALLIDGLNP